MEDRAENKAGKCSSSKLGFETFAMPLGAGVGTAAGAGIGIASGNIAIAAGIGTALGTAAGLAIGLLFNQRRKQSS